eukprot:TRINITY_DN4276_c0_g1::TRINITY_DN4276_c0_g1_i1::g.8046::m.8046 TRINITY_DN4276_c0_g1::TRINITY_DN4276_c0_g1_i1::g.8046  ORF type:complete len:285 (-),score=17.26,sp/P22045/PGFS_LEIMA/46.40/1e-84,Aldo_ket_red/PF00248.16/3.1e-56 TRINITY_DN4276_c0_g1_i1:650-1504(-)
MNHESTLELSNGVHIPLLALGTFRSRGQDAYDAVKHALELGYRHIDTAAIYRNEEQVGKAIRDSGIPRAEVFLTSKLAPTDMLSYEGVLQSFERSLQELQTGYLDLYLIHWPGAAKLQVQDPRNQDRRKQAWLALEKLYQEGKCRAIGVSNYYQHHLEDLFKYCSIKPMVNQFEIHPMLQQRALRDFCATNNIICEAYSSLGQGDLLGHTIVLDIAQELQRTPAQILLRWALQQPLVIMPKSIRKERIAENCMLYDFELSPKHMQLLDSLEQNKHFCWDPTSVV